MGLVLALLGNLDGEDAILEAGLGSVGVRLHGEGDHALHPAPAALGAEVALAKTAFGNNYTTSDTVKIENNEEVSSQK